MRDPRPALHRRHFLGAAAALPLAASASSAAPKRRRRGAPKKLLVLGGTRFLGPAIVDDALERGWEVTLFNRGKSNPHLYPDLEKLVGDRDAGDLSALEGRRFDLVADTSLYLPDHAEQAVAVLADNVGHYVNISTCSVYAPAGGQVVDEEGELATCSDEDVGEVKRIGDVYRVRGGALYGPLKARCEQALEAAMPGRVTSLRPGVIAGREDPSDRLPYWVVRVMQGGEVLAPDCPDRPVQFTDVRDLGLFANDFGDRGVSGVYNAAGFDGKVTFPDLLHGCKAVLGAKCSFTWASEEFLLQNQVRQFSEFPFWLTAENKAYWENAKGVAAGMRFRPIGDTIRETWEWHAETRGDDHEWRYYGMKPEREAELLEQWHARTEEQD